MTIRRAPHQTDYSVVRNDAIRDPALSFKARGLLMLLLSMPDTWTVNHRWLAEQSEQDGKSSVLSGLRELEANGYLRRKRWQDEAGTWVHDSVVYESRTEPDTESPVCPGSGFPSTGEPGLGEPSTDNRRIEEVTTNQVSTTPLTPHSSEEVVEPIASTEANARKRTGEELAPPEIDTETQKANLERLAAVRAQREGIKQAETVELPDKPDVLAEAR